jgi:IS605 OrfB family transposase
MEIKRSISIIIEKCQDVLDTVDEFNRFQREISETAHNKGVPLGAAELQKQVYHAIPTTLKSQMKCSAIRQVASAYSSAKSNHHPIEKPFDFKHKRVMLLIGQHGKDASFKKDGIISVNTVVGRKKLSYKIPAPFLADFKAAVEYDSLTIDGHGKASLCLTLSVPEPKGVHPVGVDLGCNNALVASTTARKTNTILFVSGKKLQIANTKLRKVRQRLQQKLAGRKAQKHDTRSVRRVLKRLSRKQRNRTRTFCKETASKLVKWCPRNSVIIFEDLKIPKVRKTDFKKRKGTRRKMNQFFYNEMIQAVKNKTERVGMEIGFVNPFQTSQICRKCGLLGIRKGHKFSCPHCGHMEHADVNSGFNIANKFTALRSSGRQSIRPEALVLQDQGQATAL